MTETNSSITIGCVCVTFLDFIQRISHLFKIPKENSSSTLVVLLMYAVCLVFVNYSVPTVVA